MDCEGSDGYACDGGCTACDGEGVLDVIAIEAPEEYPDGQVIGTCGLSQFSSAHSAFIAASREAVPALVAALRESEHALADAMAENEALMSVAEERRNRSMAPKQKKKN